MTTYTAIPNGDIDQDSPVTQPLMTLLRDNPIAISEGSTGAPYAQAAWHPYNGVTIGDGNNGGFYDQTTDGAVSSITTPDFEDGYEYLVRLQQISVSFSGATLAVDLYKETDGAYQNVSTSTAITNAAETLDGIFRIGFPRTATMHHSIYWDGVLGSSSGSVYDSGENRLFDVTVQKILRARIAPSSGNIDLGKAYLYRRRVFF